MKLDNLIKKVDDLLRDHELVKKDFDFRIHQLTVKESIFMAYGNRIATLEEDTREVSLELKNYQASTDPMFKELCSIR